MNTDKCTGCRLCENVCPKHSITFKERWFGFLYPVIQQECVHCGLCDKMCPANNIKPLDVKNAYVGFYDADIRQKCSSGGIFAALANYVLGKDGVVFGATFDEKWNVIMTYTETDITPMLGSKYVQADVKNTYKECKEFLEKGKLVLYSGTPCQIYGLKGFLKKDYDNLITVDIFCHGTPSPKAWQHYLKSFNKEIETINFRDKKNGWHDYHLTIKFKDGTAISENSHENKFMQLFLQNKILRKSCYECEHRSHSIADISIGDAWGQNTKLDDNRGLSAIIVHGDKGNDILSRLNLKTEKVSYSVLANANCVTTKHKIPKERANLLNEYSGNKKIAIVTDQVYQNIGGILQAVALSDTVKELTGIQPHFVNQKNNGHKKFFDTNCVWTTKPITDETHMIVGSDQIWNRRYCQGVPFDDKYLIHNNIRKIVYAASFGHHNNEYTKEELKKIHDSLEKVKYISTREISGTYLTQNWFGVNSVAVLDPTLLHDKEYYLKKIKKEECIDNKGIFAYILDNNPDWNATCEKLSKMLNEPILSFDKSCEQFIENFNKAKYVITDSYHGAVFSLIFNKPFICLRNMKRGNDRFDDLCLRFDLEKHFISNLADVKCDAFEKPNVNDLILSQRQDSMNFLVHALFSL